MSSEPAGPADDTATAPTRVITPAASAGRHAAVEPLDLEEAAERGRLEIAAGVVEKIAATAAGEVEAVGRAARRVFGVPAGGADDHARPRVSATVTGQVTTLALRLSITYPASVRATTEAVRAHLDDRVAELTGLRVSRVDIDVAALPAAHADSKRVVV